MGGARQAWGRLGVAWHGQAADQSDLVWGASAMALTRGQLQVLRSDAYGGAAQGIIDYGYEASLA